MSGVTNQNKDKRQPSGFSTNTNVLVRAAWSEDTFTAHTSNLHFCVCSEHATALRCNLQREAAPPTAFTRAVSSLKDALWEKFRLKCSRVCFCAKRVHSDDLLETDQWDVALPPALPFSSDSCRTMNDKLIKVITTCGGAKKPGDAKNERIK